MLSYQWWVHQPVSNNFMANYTAEVTQQVEPGAIGCGVRRRRWRKGRRSSRCTLFKGWTKLVEEDRPLFITEGLQLLNWRKGAKKSAFGKITKYWVLYIEQNIIWPKKQMKISTWICWYTKGFGIKTHWRTLKNLIRQNSTEWPIEWFSQHNSHPSTIWLWEEVIRRGSSSQWSNCRWLKGQIAFYTL